MVFLADYLSLFQLIGMNLGMKLCEQRTRDRRLVREMESDLHTPNKSPRTQHPSVFQRTLIDSPLDRTWSLSQILSEGLFIYMDSWTHSKRQLWVWALILDTCCILVGKVIIVSINDVDLFTNSGFCSCNLWVTIYSSSSIFSEKLETWSVALNLWHVYSGDSKQLKRNIPKCFIMKSWNYCF